jgi:hypothetical protein
MQIARLIAALSLIFAMQTARAEPLPPYQDYLLFALFANAQKLVSSSKDRYPDAIRQCREAEKLVAAYDRDPFNEARIILCYADIEFVLNKKQAACDLYARAMGEFQAVTAKHRSHRYAVEFSNDSHRRRLKLGC